ncbi:MAG: hypothetical protein J5958_04805 [Clostridia bacterium]|nr:hypothetical protein [Clostridia bacterium]
MKDQLKKAVASPLFLPIVSAPILFGIGVLLLSVGDGAGAWYYLLYALLHILSTALFFLGLHRVFRAIPTRGMPRALTAAIPILASLSVYHFVIAFYDAYAVQYEDGGAALLYALLSLLTDSLLSEWLLLLLCAALSYLFILCRDTTPSDKQSARLLSALVYFAFLLVGRISEFLSYKAAHLGVASEKATASFLLFAASDLALAAFGYLVLLLLDRKTDADRGIN